MEIFQDGTWLPFAFAALMALALLMYAILDGYDIGVGILIKYAQPRERDMMIASIGPFWDANETWLVLAVGLLLIAFPEANGIVLTNLYLPTAFLLIGLILRGVSFDFRAKAKINHKAMWDNIFAGGSFLMAVSQGYMLASYILGFKHGVGPLLFCLAVGLCVAAAYALIGAGWLIMKTEGVLQEKAVLWGRTALKGTVLAILIVAVGTPLASEWVYTRWFTPPNALFMMPLALLIGAMLVWINNALHKLPCLGDKGCWKPFARTVALYLLCLVGLAYSFFPYIVPGQLKIVDAASAPESLMVILVGALIVLPFMIGYTFYAYKVFHGKTDELSYN